MWHHRVRALLRLVVLSLLLGLIPPAAMPQAQAHTAAIAGPPAANAAPAATTQATAPKPIASTPAPHPEPPPPSLPAKAPVSLKQNDLARLPLAFVPNAGQTDARVKYQVRGQGGTVFFTPQEVVIAIPDKPNRGQQAGNTPIISATQPISLSVVRVSFDGASANPDIVATDRLPGTVNYLLGNDRTKWQTNLATYAGITYQSLYPGIDVHYDGTDGHLKSTYTIAPGANPNRLRWRYDGAKDVQVDAAGNLKVLLPAPGAGRPQASATYTITEDAPAAWQIIGGQRVSVPVKYAVAQNKSVSFSLGAYNAAYPVTIDPTLTSSRIVGGGAEDYGEGIAVDSDGIYVTGYTKSLDFPPTSGVVQPACGSSSSCFDAFVMKLSLDGSSRLYSTFLGGNKDDAGNRIAVDSNHNAAIVGDTHSPNFPSPPTANAYDRSCGTDEACNYNGVSYQSDVFVALLNATGTALLYSSYFGGQYSDYGNAIAIDGADKIYISGATSSPDFPSVHSIDSDGAIDDGFAAKIDPTQSGAQSLIYSAYLSGNASDGAHGIAVSSDGTAYVVGATTSTDFFKSSGAYDNHVVGGGTVFVRTLQWSQQTLTLSYGYSALIGGSGYVFTHDIAVDQYGSAYIVGRTDSSDFPKSNNAPDTSLSNDEGFITKFRSDGTDIAYSTFLGGSNYDEAFAVTVDSAGKAYIAGKTASPDFYLSSDNLRSSLGPVNNDDAFVTTVYPDGHDFQFSTFLGGEDYDLAHDIAIDSSGNMYITGQTGSSDFPAVPPEDQSVPGDDAFVIKLAPGNGSQLRREQSRGPEDCLDCKLHWVAANWFTFWPVNTRTGSYYTSVTDLAVQSPGPEIVWSRSYASQATADLTTTLGFGWQHPYSARLMLPLASGSDVTVLSGKGNQLHFSYNNGSYTPDPGIYSTLAHGTGVYTQTLLDQQQLVFSDTTGRLTGMVDSLGRKITLTYSGSPAQLTQIADANDTTRKLTLTYTSSRITQVSDGSRNVNYTYSAAGDLATVQDVRSQITNYTYQNHLLTQIKDPLNQIVEGMGYVGIGNASQVITQTIQDGRKFDFSYLPSGTTVMTSTGVDGRRTVQRFVYGSNGALSGVIDTTNPDPTKWQPLLSSGFDASFSPSSITDGNTNTTTGTYTSNGLPLQQTNALSQTTKFQYDTNRPAVITDTLGIKTLYGYDLLGNLLNVTAGVTTTSTIRATTVYTYSYLNASNVWTTLTQPLATPLPKDSRLLEQRSPDGVVTHYDYDATKAHQVVKMTVGFGTALKQETTYLYDSFGRVTSVTAAANNSTIARKDTTTYNLDNTVAQTVQNYKDGIFDSHKPDEDVITTYGYDLLGRQIWVKDALGHYDVTYYNPKGQVSSTIRNLSGFNGGTTLPANPPGYSATLPDANIATSYGYDSLGRTVLVTETGILTGTFNTSTVQFSAADTRMTKTEYDTLSRPVTVTLNYRPGLPQTADSNIPLYTRYDGAGNVITQTDALGRWTVMEYDKLNRPIKTIANYQDGLPLTGPRDADIVTTTEYDAAGRVKQQTDNWVDGTFVVTQPITDRVTLYQYDTLSRLKTTISNYLLGNSSNELNRTSTTEYHPSTGRVTGQQDSLGRWVNQQYDLLGRTIKSIQNCTNTSGTPVNPAQTACATFNSSFTDRNVPAQTAYDTLNRTTIVTDALNIETRTTYDGLGRVLKTIRNYKNGAFDNNFPDEDVATSYRYDALGRTLAITQTVNATTNAVTQHAVNALGQVTSATDPQGRVTLSGYDGAGVLRWTKRADGQITVYKVDGLGRTIATIVNYINGQRDASDKTDQDLINTTVYDAAGRRLQQIQRSDPADVVTVFVYNNQDLLIGVTENAASGTCPKTPCNVITQYQYDRAGNRTAITDPRGIADPQGKTRTFDYDAANQQIKATEPVSATFTRVTQWTYDAGGRMTGTTDPRGASNNLTLTYDGLDRPKTTSATTLGTITQNYDAGGRRTSLVDTTGTTSFTPDGLGRIKQVNAPNTGIIQYTYNGRGDRTKVVYPSPNSTTFNYTYLNDGRLQQVTQGAGLTPVARYNYDAVGRLVQAVSNTNAALNSQLITNYRYDGADRLRALRSSEAGTTVSGFQYDTDRLGLRTTITETLPLSPTLSSTRIKTMTFDGGSLTDAATGADSTLPNPTTLTLTTTGALKGGYSMVVPKIANSYLREDFTAANEVYVTLYLRVDALPSANTRLLQITNVSTGLGDLQLLTNGKLRMHNSGTTIGLDSSALTVGAVYRVGIHQKSGSGTGVLEAFLASGDNQFTSAFAGSSALTISLAASRVQVGATVSSNILAITADEITIDTAGFAQPSVNSLRANASPEASNTAESTATAIDPLAAQAPDSESSRRMAAFARLPITFVPNAGQTDPSVRFQARGLHGNLFFGVGELTMALRPPTRDKTPAKDKDANSRRQKPKNIPLAVVQQRWVGAQPTADVTGTLKLPGRANFLIGNDSSKWHTNLPTFADMLIRQLYDGIDQYYTGVDGQLKTTYVIAPGADPSRIRWRYVGADSVAVDASGNLVVHLPAPGSTLTDTEILSSTLTELAPVATQTINEREVAIPVRFVVGPDGSVSFALGPYDATQALIIDPTLTYTTYLGGSGTDSADEIAVDSSGNAYVVGSTSSPNDFPTTSPIQSYHGNYDAFVSKLSPDGSGFVYSTYFGGADIDSADAIAVDAAGYAYIAGQTLSDDSSFPVTPNVVQGSCSVNASGCYDAFVAKLNPTGSQLVYSTYLGGTNVDRAAGIAVDQAGNAYVSGTTSSSDFPQAFLSTIQANYAGYGDAFVAKLNADASQIFYSTYLGGSLAEDGGAIAVDLAGHAFVTGMTASDAVSAFSSTLQGYGGGVYFDAFVVRINSTGSALDYGTYVGGSGSDHGYGIAVDKNGVAYLTGDTQGGIPNFSGSPHGGEDAFVAQLIWDGGSLSYGYTLYLGGSSTDNAQAVALDRSGNAFVTGYTTSNDFPNTGSQSYAGGQDAFITRIDTNGYWTDSTYLGGSANDAGLDIAVDSAGIAYATGWTYSNDFGPYAGSNPVQVSFGGVYDGFVAKLALGGTPVPPATRVLSYGYDGLQRLTRATENPGAVYTYTFDLAGNRTDVWQDGLPLEHHDYDAANQVVGWTYDAAGNLINDGTNQYTYDALNRTSSLRQGGTTTNYTYNGDGTLVKQVASGVTTLYTQDLASPLSQILQSKVGAATATDYVYGLNRLASLNGSTTTWYAQDALGSVRRTFNTTATPLGVVNYDPWGTVESGSVPTFGFTGELQDTATGLVNLRARWYSTNQGKFTTVDPFAGFPEEPQTLATYAYVHNNPTNSVDPTGRWRWNKSSDRRYHQAIENEYMSKYDTAGQKIHLEYRVYMDTLFRSAARPIRYQKQPAPSFTRQIDILRSDTGDVWEIEPIAKRKDAVPQATRNMNLLRYWGIEAQNPVLYCDDCGLYDYNWNRVEWRLGINFPILRIEDWEDTPLGHTTVLVAASPEAGSILYWLELNDKVKADAAALAAIAAAAGLFGELGKGGVPRRKRPPVPAFELLCLGFLYVYSSLPVEPDVTPYLPDPLPSYPQFPGTSPAPPRLDPRAYVA